MSQALRITWPKYWSFSFSIIPSNEYSGLISFGMYREDHTKHEGGLSQTRCLIEGFPIDKGQGALAR